jgi:hypothetical protein
MAVYIATAEPAAPVPWDGAHPAFNAGPINDRQEAVRARFRQSHIMYLGAYTGCSCGFSYGTETASNTKPDEVAAARASTRALREYIEHALKSESEVELFACWEGDQDQPELGRKVVDPTHFGGDQFEFVERELLIVRRPLMDDDGTSTAEICATRAG